MYKIDMDAIERPNQKEEGILFDDAFAGMTATHMKHNTLLMIAGAVSALSPTSGATLTGITLDAIGATSKEVTADDAGENSEKVFEVQFDDAEFEYALGITMDFAEALGMSHSAILDMYDADEDIAMDEVQAFSSAINSTVHEDGNIADLITAHVHFDSIAPMYLAEDEDIEDITLDSITLDWSFSKKRTKRKAKTGTGHTMKTVECHRTIDGVRKKGFCRYPQSLLKGKYKKASGVSPKQKTNLAQMATAAHTAQEERRRALSMKLTRDARSRSNSASKSSSRKG